MLDICSAEQSIGKTKSKNKFLLPEDCTVGTHNCFSIEEDDYECRRVPRRNMKMLELQGAFKDRIIVRRSNANLVMATAIYIFPFPHPGCPPQCCSGLGLRAEPV